MFAVLTQLNVTGHSGVVSLRRDFWAFGTPALQALGGRSALKKGGILRHIGSR